MSGQATGDTIDIKAILARLIGKWWLFLLTGIVFGAMAVAYLKTSPKQYMVSSTMVMSEKSRNSFGGAQDEFIKGMSFLRSGGALEDHVAMLTSRANVEKTMKRLDFGISYFERRNYLTQERYDYRPFIVTLDTASLQIVGVPIHIVVDRNSGTYHVKAQGKNIELYNVNNELITDQYLEEVNIDQSATIGEPFVGDRLSFRIDFPEDREYDPESDYFFYINSLEGNVGYYRSKLMVEPISDASNIVKLSSPGEVINKERAFLNKLMETYLEAELYKQQQKGLKTIQFIDDQIGNVSDSLKRVESTMENFRGASGGMMNAGTTSDALFLERSRLEDERSTVMQKRQYCSSILEKLRSSEDFRNVAAPSSSGIDDAVLNSQVIQLTQLYADLAAQNTATVRSNPTIVAMERKIKNIKASLMETASGLVSQAEISLSELNRRLGTINYQFNQLPENERRLVNIERKFKLSDNLYNYLMEKRAEAGIAITSDQIDKSVVDDARLESGEPLAPNKKMVLGGAMLMALILPTALIVLLDFFDDRVRSLEELKRLTSIPVLATIPSSKRKRIMPTEPKSLLAEAFRTVRINLEYMNHGKERQVIGFTSSSSGEGKTYCAMNFSTVLALSGKRTLVMDADMRRPRLADSLGFEPGPGLSTYLIGGCTLEELIRPTDIDGLSAINAGPVPPNPLELVELPAMKQLMDTLKERYDRVVIDASPMGLVSEYVIMMRYVDVNIFVVREGYSQRRSLRLMNEMYEEKKVDRVEILFNDVKGGQGYGSGYYVD